MIALRILFFILGLVLIIVAVLSLIRTLVLYRGERDWVTSLVFVTIRRLFEFRLRFVSDYASRDRIMAYYAPISLLTLPLVWLIFILFGFMALYWASGVESWLDAFTISGSSLLTLGFARGDTVFHTILAFMEAAIGLMIVALLIAYLPTMYNAFSEREKSVSLLGVRAGTPPSPVEMILRYHRIHGLDSLHESWQAWETWFAAIEESHTTFAALVFFRSPHPEQAWITATSAVLDAASLSLSVLDMPFDAQAALCIRAGFLALRRIADFFQVPYNPDPHFPADQIRITRVDFDRIYDVFEREGLPLRSNRDQAWLDFAGWRVNYDIVLRAICQLTMAPEAQW